MNPIKMVILQTEWHNNKTLETYSKMTPGRSGKWKNLIGVDSIKDADLAVIIDYTTQDVPKDMPKVYMGAHPKPCGGYCNYDEGKKDKNTLAVFDLEDTFGFGEWWIDWDYDELTKLESPKKTKNLSCILSNKRQMAEHNRRRMIVSEFCNKYPELIDVYGRIIPDKNEQSILKSYKGILGTKHASIASTEIEGSHCGGKTPALFPYRYSLEFDYYCKCPNYFSERVFDAMLLWAMPIYSGGKGVHKFLPRNSYCQIDSWKVTPEEILGYVDSDFREKNIKYDF